MNDQFTEFLGPNWRTTLAGGVSRLFLGFLLAAQFQPDLIFNMFGNTPFTKTFIAICLFIWFAFGVAKDVNTKDKQIAGNNPDAVTDGNVATKVTTK